MIRDDLHVFGVRHIAARSMHGLSCEGESLSHPDALPDTIWQEFVRRAGDHGIEIIPLLQTWGDKAGN